MKSKTLDDALTKLCGWLPADPKTPITGDHAARVIDFVRKEVIGQWVKVLGDLPEQEKFSGRKLGEVFATLTAEQQRYAVSFFLGGTDMVADGFNEPHADQRSAIWARQQFGEAMTAAINVAQQARAALTLLPSERLAQNKRLAS